MSNAKGTLLFVTSAYEPYVIDEDKAIGGIFSDIVKAAFNELNITSEFMIQPWQRGEITVMKGDAFATFPYLKNEKRSKDFNFSDPVIYFFPKFLYKKDKFPNGFSWEALIDFQKYRIGGVQGYWYKQSFENAGLHVNYVKTDMQNIQMLMKERIDFTLISELVGWSLIKKTYPQKKSAFAFAKKPESIDTFHLMVSKSYPDAKEYLKQFNDGLKIIKGNGIYTAIFKKYEVPTEYEVIQE